VDCWSKHIFCHGYSRLLTILRQVRVHLKPSPCVTACPVLVRKRFTIADLFLTPNQAVTLASQIAIDGSHFGSTLSQAKKCGRRQPPAA